MPFCFSALCVLRFLREDCILVFNESCKYYCLCIFFRDCIMILLFEFYEETIYLYLLFSLCLCNFKFHDGIYNKN